jgi:hypothetical protein
VVVWPRGRAARPETGSSWAGWRARPVVNWRRAGETGRESVDGDETHILPPECPQGSSRPSPSNCNIGTCICPPPPGGDNPRLERSSGLGTVAVPIRRSVYEEGMRIVFSAFLVLY